MFSDKKNINIDITLEYEYDYELDKIKEIIKQIIDLKGLINIEIDQK